MQNTEKLPSATWCDHHRQGLENGRKTLQEISKVLSEFDPENYLLFPHFDNVDASLRAIEAYLVGLSDVQWFPGNED